MPSLFFIEPQKLRTQRTFQRIHFTRFTLLCSARLRFVLCILSENFCCCFCCHHRCCCLCCSYLWSFPLQFIVVNNNKYIYVWFCVVFFHSNDYGLGFCSSWLLYMVCVLFYALVSIKFYLCLATHIKPVDYDHSFLTLSFFLSSLRACQCLFQCHWRLL